MLAESIFPLTSRGFANFTQPNLGSLTLFPSTLNGGTPSLWIIALTRIGLDRILS
jgi:hypothetical protein